MYLSKMELRRLWSHFDPPEPCIFVAVQSMDVEPDTYESNFMHDVSRTMLRALGLAVLCVVVSGCNIQGFFTDYGDVPKWEDPNAAMADVSGGGASGGPGKGIYSRVCAACHLGSGKGLMSAQIPPLAGSEYAQGDSEIPIKIVLHGFRGPITRGGTVINGQMASWKDQLSDQEIADVLTYVRSSFGNSGGAVSADDVASVREATTSRLIPFSESDL